MEMLTDNMPRLAETENSILSILAELFEYKTDGAENAEDFSMLKNVQYMDAEPELSVTGIIVPVVPDGC